MSLDVVNMGSLSGQFLFVISKKMLMTNTTSSAFAHTHRVFSQGFGGPSPANLINCLVGRNTLVWWPDKILKEGGRSDISGYLGVLRKHEMLPKSRGFAAVTGA